MLWEQKLGAASVGATHIHTAAAKLFKVNSEKPPTSLERHESTQGG